MFQIIQTTIGIAIRPRETAKLLDKKSNINITILYFLITVTLNFYYIDVSGVSAQITNIWIINAYILGISLVRSCTALILPSFILNIFSPIVNGKRNFIKTLLSILWTLGPGMLLIVPIVLVNILFTYTSSIQLFSPNELTIKIIQFISFFILYLAILIKIILQLIFLSEVYQISVVKVILLHIMSIAFAILTVMGLVIVFL